MAAYRSPAHSFNGVERTGSIIARLRTCRDGHRWGHLGGEYYHDGSEAHYFECADCGRVEHDLSDKWKYLRSPEARAAYERSRCRPAEAAR